MKKVFSTLVIIFSLVLLVACTDTKVDASPVVISKLYTTTRQANNVIELYNPTDKEIDLTTHKLNFYSNGSKEVSKTIELTGKITANSYYLVTGNNHNVDSVKQMADFIYSEGSLPFNGDDAIELNHNGNRSDLIGNIGLDIIYSKELTLIRVGLKEDYKPQAEYKEFNFIGYTNAQYKYLKNDNYEIKTLEDLYKGPKLEERYLTELPFVSETDANLGGGGAVIASVQSISDGDTAFFKAQNGFGGGSVRYFYINTPEVNGSNVNAEPWGYVASKYNKQYLLNNASSKEIRLQSIPEYSLKEGYGRSLGLIWINGNLSQFLIAAEGLSAVPNSYASYDLLLTYKDVPYLTFLRFAQNRAIENGWGVHGYPAKQNGQVSPDWDYNANNGAGGLLTTDPQWTPMLTLPF